MNRAEELLDIAEQNADWARAQREEYRAAAADTTGGELCRDGHHMVPDGRGGGFCTDCPLVVDRDEL